MNMISASKKIIYIFFFLVSTISGQNQLEEQYKYALELFESENYFDAITEFKRLLFFDHNKEYSYTANIIIAESYKAGGWFSDAIRYFTIAELSSKIPEDVYTARIGNVKSNILRRTTDRAIRLIDEMLIDSRFIDKKKDLLYWKGWSLIFANRFEEASTEFFKIDPYHELYYLTKNLDESLYSKSTAKILSYIIPGAGQFYTGEYLSGLLSLGWNVLWGYLTIKSFVDERIFDGLVISNFLWLRFYNGSVQNAEKFANEKNQVLINKALDYLQYQYSGQKP